MATSVQRSRTRATLFGVLAVFTAAATAYAAWVVVSRYEQELVEARQGVEDHAVVVATRDLRAGTTIGPDDVRVETRPVSRADKGLFGSVDTVIGKTIGDRVLEGEVVRMERLVSGGAALRADEVIDVGTRAVSIRTTRASALGGLLQPGHLVDVIVTIRPENRALEADWVTETILQGVKVIAIGDSGASSRMAPQEADDEEGERGRVAREFFVTLEVEPAEAEELALASARGEIHLSMRAADDFQMLEPGTPLVTNALVGLPAHVQEAQARRLTRKRQAVTTPAPAEPTGTTTEVIRGGKVSVEQFNEQGEHILPAGKR